MYLIIKAINLSDLAGFMISTDQSDAIGISDFESNEKQNGLNRVEASINKVTQEEVVCLAASDVSSPFEQLFQIIKLSMNIPTNLFKNWFNVIMTMTMIR